MWWHMSAQASSIQIRCLLCSQAAVQQTEEGEETMHTPGHLNNAEKEKIGHLLQQLKQSEGEWQPFRKQH